MKNIPDIVGMKVPAAKKLLKEAGITYNIKVINPPVAPYKINKKQMENLPENSKEQLTNLQKIPKEQLADSHKNPKEPPLKNKHSEEAPLKIQNPKEQLADSEKNPTGTISYDPTKEIVERVLRVESTSSGTMILTTCKIMEPDLTITQMGASSNDKDAPLEESYPATQTGASCEGKDAPLKGMPRHIAIIMDGNGRWAKKRGMPRIAGHNAGMKTVKEIVRACSDLGVKYLTVYAFSTENWKRPATEVKGIFNIMVKYIKKELKELVAENVKIRVVGDWSKIPEDAENSMKKALADTENNDGLVFNIALNYGGRTEIMDAIRAISREIIEKDLSPREASSYITESLLESHLSTAGMPDPDMIIRTGGERRLSNFLLWQCAYSEFIFTDTFWPDFNKEELLKCIDEYYKRDRRYGGLNT